MFFHLTHFCLWQQGQAAVVISALLWLCTVAQRCSPCGCEHPFLVKEKLLPADTDLLLLHSSCHTKQLSSAWSFVWSESVGVGEKLHWKAAVRSQAREQRSLKSHPWTVRFIRTVQVCARRMVSMYDTCGAHFALGAVVKDVSRSTLTTSSDRRSEQWVSTFKSYKFDLPFWT